MPAELAERAVDRLPRTASSGVHAVRHSEARAGGQLRTSALIIRRAGSQWCVNGEALGPHLKLTLAPALSSTPYTTERAGADHAT
jgi:hypothetical protein